MERSGTLRPSSSTAPAATMHHEPTFDLSLSVQLLPSRQWSPTVSAWQMTRSAMAERHVVKEPMVRSPSAWQTEPSWMLVPSPIVIVPRSERRTTPGQIEA